MITDLAVAKLVAAIYQGKDAADWAHFDDGSADDGICWGISVVQGIAVVVFRGSVTVEDWARDLDAAVWFDRDLGPVHMGFLQGMKDCWQEFAKQLGAIQPWVAAGHSLGAARAQIFAAFGTFQGHAPAAVVVCGEPRNNLGKMAGMLAEVPNRSYRCEGWGGINTAGFDTVTDLPPAAPLGYKHGGEPRSLIGLHAIPVWGDLSPFRYHHMALYLDAIAKLSPMPTIGGSP